MNTNTVVSQQQVFIKGEVLMLELVVQSLIVILLPIILIVASWIDLRQHRIPNLLTLSVLIIGVSLQFLLYGWEGLIYSFGGLAIGYNFEPKKGQSVPRAGSINKKMRSTKPPETWRIKLALRGSKPSEARSR